MQKTRRISRGAQYNRRVDIRDGFELSLPHYSHASDSNGNRHRYHSPHKQLEK